MNPSRLSYTMSLDSKYEYDREVILHKCEFCNRTFIPDSLTKHRKMCYRDYLKKRSKVTNLKSRNIPRSKSAMSYTKDGRGISLTELMISRHKRRMNWRDRHQEFINTIREARMYAIALNNGLNPPPPAAMDRKEDMIKCKYCLRNFNKDAITKHSSFCKEHSIQSSRYQPNDAHLEAKRRMSLRLYYKPKSFKDDSQDDMTTSITSHDFDCQSMATLNSVYGSNDISQVSRVSSRTSLNQRTRTVSAVVSKVPKDSTNTKTAVSITSSKACHKNSGRNISKGNTSEKFNPQPLIKNPKCRTPTAVTSVSIGKYSIPISNQDGRHRKMSTKLKEVSEILQSQEPENSDGLSLESDIKGPNSCESFNKAKEILQYLSTRAQQKELSKDNQHCLPQAPTVEDQIEQKLAEGVSRDTRSEARMDIGQMGDEATTKEEINIELKDFELDFSEILARITGNDGVSVADESYLTVTHNQREDGSHDNERQPDTTPTPKCEKNRSRMTQCHADPKYSKRWQK